MAAVKLWHFSREETQSLLMVMGPGPQSIDCGGWAELRACWLTLYGSCVYGRVSNFPCSPSPTSCSPQSGPQRMNLHTERLQTRWVLLKDEAQLSWSLGRDLACRPWLYLETAHWPLSCCCCWGFGSNRETWGWSSGGGGWWTAVWASGRTPGSVSAWRFSRRGPRCFAGEQKVGQPLQSQRCFVAISGGLPAIPFAVNAALISERVKHWRGRRRDPSSFSAQMWAAEVANSRYRCARRRPRCLSVCSQTPGRSTGGGSPTRTDSPEPSGVSGGNHWNLRRSQTGNRGRCASTKKLMRPQSK